MNFVGQLHSVCMDKNRLIGHLNGEHGLISHLLLLPSLLLFSIRLCLGLWSLHNTASGGYYKCNIYESQKSKGELSERETAMADAKAKIQKVNTRKDNNGGNEKR